MKDFIFKDIKGQLARVGLFVSDTETHDFLMTVAEVNDNIDKFGERPELIILSGRSLIRCFQRRAYPYTKRDVTPGQACRKTLNISINRAATVGAGLKKPPHEAGVCLAGRYARIKYRCRNRNRPCARAGPSTLQWSPDRCGRRHSRIPPHRPAPGP